eukprot:scaffold78625_cov36-Phaeocystis_antarctica.AAC.1
MLKPYRKVPGVTASSKLGFLSTAPSNPRMSANFAFVRACSLPSATSAAASSVPKPISTSTARTAPFAKSASSGSGRIVKSDGGRPRKAASPSTNPGFVVPFTYRSGL